jgi:hypothetical protein
MKAAIWFLPSLADGRLRGARVAKSAAFGAFNVPLHILAQRALVSIRELVELFMCHWLAALLDEPPSRLLTTKKPSLDYVFHAANGDYHLRLHLSQTTNRQSV